jgi:hypothetical protein
MPGQPRGTHAASITTATAQQDQQERLCEESADAVEGGSERPGNGTARGGEHRTPPATRVAMAGSKAEYGGNNHGAQVPEVGAQAHLFGTSTNGGGGGGSSGGAGTTSSGSRSPLERSLYSNGLHSNHASLLELDKALNYEVRVVTGNSNIPLAQEIANHLRVRITAAEVSRFSDGEIRVSIGENVRGKDVFLIQSTSPPVNDHLMELLVIIDTLKRASAKRITAVMPYYGYGRQGTIQIHTHKPRTQSSWCRASSFCYGQLGLVSAFCHFPLPLSPTPFVPP